MSLLAVVALFCAGQSSLAQLIGEDPIPPHPNNAIPDYDFEWVVINRPGNVAYDGSFKSVGGVFSYTEGRGSVLYTYRVSMLEITSAQYMEYLNVFAVQSDALARLVASSVSGGFTVDPFYNGPGGRFILHPNISNAAMQPVMSISWRQAAMFCNWLHNGKSSDPATLHFGAYNTSTFTRNPDGSYNDQPTRSPGARFWIPSLDEWLKAVHFDPNRFGEGQPGWWRYPYGSDTLPVAGLPIDEGAETSAGYGGDLFLLIETPLRSYPHSRTPWGLWDASGGQAEWTEEIEDGRIRRRITNGMQYNDHIIKDLDNIDRIDRSPPVGFLGFRLAGAVQRRADMDGDLFVDGADLAYLLQRWGTGDVGADMNGDGVVGGADLGLMLGAWGR